MTSIQYLINERILHIICNFRSQHETLGRPNDEKMINFIATKFINNLKHEIDKVYITCNVADYHNY